MRYFLVWYGVVIFIYRFCYFPLDLPSTPFIRLLGYDMPKKHKKEKAKNTQEKEQHEEAFDTTLNEEDESDDESTVTVMSWMDSVSLRLFDQMRELLQQQAEMMKQREEHSKLERENWVKQREDDMKRHTDLEKRLEDDRKKRDEEATRLSREQHATSLDMQKTWQEERMLLEERNKEDRVVKKYLGRIPQMAKREQVPSCFQHLEEALKQDSELAGFELKLVEALVRNEVHTAYWQVLESGDRRSFAEAKAALRWAGYSPVSSLMRWQSMKPDEGGIREFHKEAVQLSRVLVMDSDSAEQVKAKMIMVRCLLEYTRPLQEYVWGQKPASAVNFIMAVETYQGIHGPCLQQKYKFTHGRPNTGESSSTQAPTPVTATYKQNASGKGSSTGFRYRCFSCNEVGHQRKDCPKLKSRNVSSIGAGISSV